ncbi:MAG: hypothetical protein ACRDPZ_14430, partial [Gaiellaceae bacterium]
MSRAVVLAAAFLLVGCGGTHTDRAPAPEPKFRLDVARRAGLYLEQGRRNGRQIVPTAWVRDSTRVQVRVPSGHAYGYLWWVN